MSQIDPRSSAVPPGWFPDPDDPSRERWWMGSTWSTKTHRPPRGLNIYWPDYTRSFWIGQNTTALVAQIVTSIAFVAGVILPVLLAVSASSPTTELTTVIVLVLLIAAITGPVGLVAGIVALTRARRKGALGLSIWSVVVAGIATILTLPWLLGWIALGIAGASG
jgi:hypothetical protein